MGIDLVYVVNDRVDRRRPLPGWLTGLLILGGIVLFGWLTVALLGVFLG